MGQVNFILEGDEAKAVQAFLKVINAQKKVETGMNRIGRQGKQTDKTFGRMSQNMTRDLSGMVMGWATVGTAITGVSRALQSVIADMKRMDDQNKSTIISLTQRIAGAGDMAQGQEIRKFLVKNLKGTGVGVKEGGEVYGAIRGAAPSMDLTRILKLTRGASGAKKAGFMGEDLTSFATMSGEIAKMAPEKSVGDVMDLTTYVKQLEGRYGKQVVRTGMGVASQFVESQSGSLEEGLGLVLASVQSGQKATGAQLIVQKLREQRDVGEGGFGGGGGNDGLRAFYAASPKERMQMIRGDKDLRGKVFGTQAASVEAVLSADPTKLTKGAMGAQRGNLFNKAQIDALQDRLFAEEMMVSEEEAGAERAEFARDEGRQMRNLRLDKARMRKAGVPAWLRSSLNWLGETGVSLGIDYDTSDLAAGAERMSGSAKLTSDLADAAEKLNAAADKTLDASNRTANVNAHVENNEFGNN